MQPKLSALLAPLLMLGGCSTPQPTTTQAHTTAAAAPNTAQPAPTVTAVRLSYTPEVRKLSYADDRLFRDMITSIGGVDFYDRVSFPKATVRVLIRIEVLVPYDNHRTGIEHWTIQHEDEVTATYVVNFVPDGRGGTNFSVGKDKGSTKP